MTSTTSTDLVLRSLQPEDRDWVRRFIVEHWGDEKVIARGKVYYPSEYPGFTVKLENDNDPVGLITFEIQDDRCEILSIDSVRPGLGIGTRLIEAVADSARQVGCKHLSLITANDNLHALRFYQKRGFVLVALYPDAMKESRKLKPQIPLVGFDGIPIRDEIALELAL